MSDRLFSNDHEWIEVVDGIGTIGISGFAQEQLGDVVYVEMPEIGSSFDPGDELGVIESVKAASEIYAPVSGEVVEVNDDLMDDPSQVNADPYGQGWIVRIQLSNASQLDALMDEDSYASFIAGSS